MDYIDYRLHYACSLMSQIVYPGDWKKEKEALHDIGFDEVRDVEENGTAQVRIARSSGLQIISIRGTTYEDILSDMRVMLMQDPNGIFPGKVHTGFWEYTQQVLDLVWPEVYSCTYEHGTILTGHSLGAASAAILQGILPVRYAQMTEVISFGCPRFANHHYRSVMRRRKYRHYRWVYANDGVTRIPWHPLRYVHSGTPCYIKVNGSHIVRPPLGYITMDRFGRFQRCPFRWAKSLKDDHDMAGYVNAMKGKM